MAQHTEVLEREGLKFNHTEIRENILAVTDWSKEFELPDIIDFADYATNSAAVANDLQSRVGALEEEPGLLLPFPYPKSASALRCLHVAAPEELIVLRTAAGRVIRLTDALLSPKVFSSRLDQKASCWRFRPWNKANREFISRGLSLLDGRRNSAMYRTDIEAYYPSIDVKRVRRLLKNWQCFTPAADFIFNIYKKWQSRDRLQGLPIGPEASGVLGNIFLRPIDTLLEAHRYEHLRWCDDILIFGRTISNCAGSIGLVDNELSKLGVSRSITKTHPFDNVSDARRNLSDYWLNSLSNVIHVDNDVGREAIRGAYDSKIKGNPEVEGRRFRWVLRTLKNKNDPYACASLARDPSLMNVDPKESGEYMAMVGLRDSVCVNGIMDRISKPAQDLFDALNLHLLKALKGRRFGQAEAKEFKRIATDSSRRWPVRVYGWAAYVKTTQDYLDLMEAARAETIPQLRRGMIASLKGHASRKFLTHAREDFPESRYTVQWLQS